MLKKIGSLFCVILLLCCVFTYARSASNVTIVWDYDDPPSDLAGFELRLNEDNDTLISISPDVRLWTGSLEFLNGNNTLDMRVKDKTEQMSDWSEPCYYDPTVGIPPDFKIIFN